MHNANRMDISPRSYSIAPTRDVLAQGLPFRVESAGYFECGPAYYTQRSGMANYLLIYTLSGAGEADWGEGRRALPPGSAVLIDCMEYQYYATAGESWQFYYVHFQGQMKALAPMLCRRGAIFPEHADDFERQFARVLAAADAIDPMACLTCSDLISRLLTQLALVVSRTRDDADCRRIPALEACIAYLRAHCAEPITLEDMARRVHMSKYHFTRVFQAYTRATPHAYLTALRINQARRLLTLRDESVQEIACAVGMPDCNGFIRAFKKHCGVTPSAYRRLWQGRGACKEDEA